METVSCRAVIIKTGVPADEEYVCVCGREQEGVVSKWWRVQQEDWFTRRIPGTVRLQHPQLQWESLAGMSLVLSWYTRLTRRLHWRG